MECVTIPMRLPGLNEYIASCNSSRYKGNRQKQKTQNDIAWFLKQLPEFKKPIRIKFIWVSQKGDRRDLDNIAFAKKYILDAMQQCGKLSNDNRKHFVGFTDEFCYGKEYEVRLEIKEEE